MDTSDHDGQVGGALEFVGKGLQSRKLRLADASPFLAEIVGGDLLLILPRGNALQGGLAGVAEGTCIYISQDKVRLHHLRGK